MTNHAKNLRDHAALLAAKYGFAVNAAHHVLTAAADELDRLNQVESQHTELRLALDEWTAASRNLLEIWGAPPDEQHAEKIASAIAEMRRQLGWMEQVS